MTVIYLTDNSIQLVQGTGSDRISRVSPVCSLNGYMTQGVVADSEQFCGLVRQLFADGKFSLRDVTLVLNTNPVITRTMKAPDRPDAEMLKYVANEMAYVQRAETPLYGYYRLSTDKKTKLCRILAMVTDRQVVQGYLDEFAKCGVQIVSVRPALIGVIRMLGGHRMFHKKTVILQIVEDNGFYNLLFHDGVYVYSDYNGTIHEQGSEEHAYDLAKAVSNLVRFTTAQRFEEPVSGVFLIGSLAEERQNIMEAVESLNPQMPVQMLDENAAKGMPTGLSCVFASGAMKDSPRAARTYDLLQRMQQEKKQATGKSFLFRALILGAALTVLLGGVSAGLIVHRNRLQQEVDALIAYNTSSEVLQQVSHYDDLLGKRTDLQQRSSGLDSLRELLDGYPLPNSRVNSVLQRCADGLASVEITQYDSGTGTLTVNVTSAEVDLINQFVERLRKEEIFNVQQYSGYQKLKDGTWAVNVVLNLSASAGR